jgi:alkylation response protein AidB-like acyl-CoA dehydrogenase
MSLAVTADQVDLARAVREWAGSLGASEAIRAEEHEPQPEFEKVWRQVEEFGLCSIAADGGTLLDQAIALEEAAYALVPGPLLATTLAGLGLETGEDVRGLDLSRRTPTGLPDDPRAVALAAAEAAGVARWCLDTAVSYAKVREQFGAPIGSFQAIKHLCAEMLETSQAVTAAAWDCAVGAAEGDREQATLAAAVAGVTCFEAAVTNAHACIQVLGGIGFTFEHDAHLYLRRALALRALAGAADTWAGRLTEGLATGVRRRRTLDLGAAESRRAEIAAEADRIAAADDQRAALVESGYLVPHWPAPYGLGADAATQLLIDQELSRACVRRPELKIAGWALPTILEHGSEEQRERFVGPTLAGDLTWCQLFSEPGAGSDLASLRTKAERVDGGWRLTGQKVWTSLAHEADWAICLARTNSDGKPQAGITYFLVDMRSEGLEIRPLREMTGAEMFNEVFLDGVLVPDECVVGEVDGGWRLARTTLSNERVAMGGHRLDASVERAIELVGEDPVRRMRVGRAAALASVCQALSARATLRSLTGAGPGAESSVAKLLGVRNRQEASDLVLELLGPRAVGPDVDDEVFEALLTRCLSIAGGTTQVLRNVAAERILGLPR